MIDHKLNSKVNYNKKLIHIEIILVRTKATKINKIKKFYSKMKLKKKNN
jgi:hypothetical protein